MLWVVVSLERRVKHLFMRVGKWVETIEVIGTLPCSLYLTMKLWRYWWRWYYKMNDAHALKCNSTILSQSYWYNPFLGACTMFCTCYEHHAISLLGVLVTCDGQPYNPKTMALGLQDLHSCAGICPPSSGAAFRTPALPIPSNRAPYLINRFCPPHLWMVYTCIHEDVTILYEHTDVRAVPMSARNWHNCLTCNLMFFCMNCRNKLRRRAQNSAYKHEI